MAMQRTPEKTGNTPMTTSVCFPTARLGALTRKKNDMMAEIHNKSTDVDRLSLMLEDFDIKLQNFHESCLPSLTRDRDAETEDQRIFNKWYEDHFSEMDKFRQQVKEWLNEKKEKTEEIKAGDSVSQVGSARSTRSNKSKGSSVKSKSSSLKIELAKRRAQHQAEEAVLKEKHVLEKQQEEENRQQEEAIQEQNRQQEEENRQQEEAIQERKRQQEVAIQERKRQQEELNKEHLRQLELLDLKKARLEDENLQTEINKLDGIGSQAGTSKVSSNNDGELLNLKKLDTGFKIQNPYFDTVVDTKSVHSSKIEFPIRERKTEKLKFPIKETRPDSIQFNGDQLAKVLEKQNEISVRLLHSQEKANLPKHVPETFDGTDFTQYKSFIQNFERIIERGCIDDIDRFHYLETYTSGLPYEVVKGCRSKDPLRGYQKARKALEKEFGDEGRIADAYLNKIENIKPIKNEDGKALRELSIFLMGCNNMMEDISPLNQLNSRSEMRKIVGKLPFRMKDGWRRLVLNKKDQCKTLSFEDLCKFVQRQSDLINEPDFGNIIEPKEIKKDEVKKKFSSAPKTKAFSTAVKDNNNTPTRAFNCICCKKTNHQLKTCFFFRDKSHQDKLKLIKEKKLCFGCLSSTTHMYKDCKYKLKCETCKGNHPTIMHIKSENKESIKTSSQPQSQASGEDQTAQGTIEESVMACATNSRDRIDTGAGEKVRCPSVPVRVRAMGSNKMILTYMGLDPYCSDVFMSENLLKSLGIRGHEAEVSLTTMTGKGIKTKTKIINNLEIYDLDENERSLIPVVYCKMQNWPFNKEDTPKKSDLEKLMLSEEVPFRFIDAEIGLLVGLNQPDILRPLKIINGSDQDGPYATLHKHGYALNGPVGCRTNKSHQCFRIKLDSPKKLDAKYVSLCDQEFQDDDLDIRSPSISEQKWERKVRSTFKKCPDGHFEVELPFADDEVIFPSNREQVLSRLLSSKKRMRVDIEFSTEYKAFMDMMFKSGFAEVVPEEQMQTAPGKSWYLVHFGVFHKQKKKLRVVFDASLKCRGVSLNDMLLQGPDLTSNLLGVLLRFRQEKVAFMADIQKMFYQVRVPEHQRDFLRFLWFPDGDIAKTPKEYRVTVHIFGAVSSPSIANFTLRELTEISDTNEFDDKVKNAVLKNFYVDDLVKSDRDNESAIYILREVCRLVSCGGFKLTAFVSNSREVLLSVPDEELQKDLKNLDLALDDLPHEKALGVHWNIRDDMLGFSLKLPEKRDTKRGVLSTVFSVYDPFGIASPVILVAKKIFQKTCYDGLHWDEPLPPSLLSEWNEWWQGVHLLKNYQIPRCFKTGNDVKETQLHLFCDGSEIAFAAVAYLRFTYENRDVSSSLVMSKTRLVPLKGSALVTTPRVELNGAKLAVQLFLTLKRELQINIDKTYFWTDSTTVLKYINCESRRLQRFVCNRVTFIRAHTKTEDWRHVPGTLNPADLASRGTSSKKLVTHQQWKRGPEFIYGFESKWPSMQIDVSLKQDDSELKKEKLIMAAQVDHPTPTDKLLQSLSDWHLIVKRVAWFMRFRSGLYTRVWNNNELQPIELQLAKRTIFKYIQDQEFTLEISSLKTNKVLPKNNRLIKLHPFLDQNKLLRVGGRISKAVASYEVKHPIILSKNHYLIRRLAEWMHKQVGHQGREALLAELRKTYWIIGANTLAREMSRNCVLCRKYNAKPVQQIMGNLPGDRLLSDIPPFTNTGLDCFGPFMVSRGRTREKRYGVVFSCLNTRAIHLEIVHSLETDSFICALRRFGARRGLPKLIRSDNGTNLVGAEKELRKSIEVYNHQKMKDFLLQKDITWKFQPPAASHFGGVWEREIRSIRKILNALMSEQPMRLHDEELNTLMCEVESILNSRPLTAVSDDPNDLEALTPNHLLLARSGITFPPGLFSKDDLCARRRWRQVQYLSDLFWTRWRKEFLPLLQERHVWSSQGKSCEVDDLVLLVDQLMPRSQWSLGRIAKTYPDDEGRVRVVDVRIAKVKGELKPGNRTTIMQRPISKIIILKYASQL